MKEQLCCPLHVTHLSAKYRRLDIAAAAAVAVYLQVTGQCPCKINVQGRRCDVCNDTYYTAAGSGPDASLANGCLRKISVTLPPFTVRTVMPKVSHPKRHYCTYWSRCKKLNIIGNNFRKVVYKRCHRGP